MDSVKPEVKQSRAQRANKDSRSAKQRYGKDRNRDEDLFEQQSNRQKKKKDPNRKGAFIKPEPVAKPAEPEGNLTVKAGSWNVRTGPGTDYAIAAVAHGGDKLNEILPTGWIPVLYNGEIRWISEKAVE